MTDPYASCPVDRTSQEIRLLTLHPNNDEGIIKCDMQTYNHHDRPPYSALSYTWGPEMVYTNIEINGVKVPVRENLWDFLQQQRLHGNYGPFWIDALCIQQSEVHERNHQVRMMDSIYTQARAVLVWLGKEQDDSDIAMQALEDGTWDFGQPSIEPDQDPWQLLYLPGQEEFWRLARSILTLFQREYWSRMWIIQEVMLAHSLKILCGTKIIREYKLKRFAKHREKMSDPLNERAYVPIHKDMTSSPAWSIVTMRSALTKEIIDTNARFIATMIRSGLQIPHKGIGLQRLLQTYGHHECEDIRDKVYALSGVWIHKSALDIDYRKSAKDILLDVFYLESTRMSWEGNWNRRSLLMIGFLLAKTLDVAFPKPEVQFHLDCSRDIASENLVINDGKRSWAEFCEAVKSARENASCSYGSQYSK